MGWGGVCGRLGEVSSIPVIFEGRCNAADDAQRAHSDRMATRPLGRSRTRTTTIFDPMRRSVTGLPWIRSVYTEKQPEIDQTTRRCGTRVIDSITLHCPSLDSGRIPG
jgi:hypothetical protein